jgi:hypothetical protein
MADLLLPVAVNFLSFPSIALSRDGREVLCGQIGGFESGAGSFAWLLASAAVTEGIAACSPGSMASASRTSIPISESPSPTRFR